MSEPQKRTKDTARLRNLIRSMRSGEPVTPQRLSATALRLMNSMDGETDPRYAAVLNSVGCALYDLHWNRQALPFLETALKIAQHNSNDRQALKASKVLALCYQRLGLKAESANALRVALEIAKRGNSQSTALRFEKALETLRAGKRYTELLIAPARPPARLSPGRESCTAASPRKNLPSPVQEHPHSILAAIPGRFCPSTKTALESGTDPCLEGFRVQIETWLMSYPKEMREKLVRRLWNNNEGIHLSAFYELFLHEYCLHRGWHLDVEPSIGGKHPDFRVAAPEGEFLLEVGTFGDRNDNPETTTGLENFLTCLDGLTSSHFLSVDLLAVPSPTDITAIRDLVESWLLQMAKGMQPPRLLLDQLGIEARLAAIPKNGIDSRGSVYEWSPPPLKPKHCDSANAVSKAVDKERKFMQAWRAPLVIASCTRENAVLDDVSLCSELFGDVSIELRRDGTKLVKLSRRGSHFRPTSNRKISALLFCTRRRHRCRVEYDMRIIHNPWAHYPLDPKVFAGHRQLVTKESANGLVMEWLDWHSLTYSLLRASR